MKKHNRWLTLIGLGLAAFLGCVDFTIVNTALPAIQANLHASVIKLQWIINIFMLTLSALMVIQGRLADIYGHRRVLYIGMIVFAISSLGAGLSPNIDWLILFRFIQGVGVAILYTVPMAMVPNLFPENERGKATGVLLGISSFGLASGPVLGGFIVSALSWRWIFFVNLPILVISFILLLGRLQESKSHEHGNKIDWWGFILLIISLPLLVFATVNATQWGWTSPLILGMYGVAIIALIAFYFVESNVQSPIIKLKLFMNRVFFGSIVANFALAFFYTVIFFLIPLYLHNIFNESSYMIGLILLPATAMVAILSPIAGRIVDKSGPKKVILIGFALFAISALMQTFFSAQTHLWYIITSLIILGTGWGFILSPSIAAGLSSVPQNISGVAMGSIGILHNFGGAIGLALGVVVYHFQSKLILMTDVAKNNITPGGWLDKAIANPDNAIGIIQQNSNLDLTKSTMLFQHFFTHGYSRAMWLLVAISCMAFLIVLFLLKNKKVKAPESLII